jgi:hypothetical protein
MAPERPKNSRALPLVLLPAKKRQNRLIFRHYFP